MHTNHYEKLKRKIGHSYGEIDEDIHLYISDGKHKGKICKAISIEGSSVTMQVAENKTVKIVYTKLEQVDEKGEPIFSNSLDITGRPVIGNNIVCYSVKSGQTSHAMEIGRVIKTNPSGSLSIKPIIHNGEKIKYNSIRSKITANRVIILPVALDLVTTWVLSDFEVYKEAVELTSDD